MPAPARFATTYAVALRNGQESCYTSDRALAERAFMACAAVGPCSLEAIRQCERRTLARSLDRTSTPTLGAFQEAVAPFHAEALALERRRAKAAKRALPQPRAFTAA